MRKKITSVILAAALAMMLVGCGGNEKSGSTAATSAATEKATSETVTTEANTEKTDSDNVKVSPTPGSEEVDPPIVGGWTRAESPVVTKEIQDLVKKANEVLVGAQYEAVAVIATQVVAGLNYRLLCTVTATVPDAKPYYAIVTLWKNPQGEASITDVVETTIEAPSAEPMDGGIAAPASTELTAEAKTAFDKATETLTGASYKPIALVATQVVAGINYFIFCEANSVTPDGETGYAILTVTAAADGSYSVYNIEDIK